MKGMLCYLKWFSHVFHAAVLTLVPVSKELIRKGVSRQDCQNALEGVFGESSRGRIRVDLGDLQKEDVDKCTLFGNEGRISLVACLMWTLSMCLHLQLGHVLQHHPEWMLLHALVAIKA